MAPPQKAQGAFAEAAHKRCPQIMGTVMDAVSRPGILTPDRHGRQARAELIPNLQQARAWLDLAGGVSAANCPAGPRAKGRQLAVDLNSRRSDDHSEGEPTRER